MADEELYWGRIINDTSGDDEIHAGATKEGALTGPYTIVNLTAGNNTVYCENALVDIHIKTAGRTDTIYHGEGSIMKIYLDACSTPDTVKYEAQGDSLKITFDNKAGDVITKGTVIVDSFFTYSCPSDYIVTDMMKAIGNKLKVTIDSNSANLKGTRYTDEIILNSNNKTVAEKFRNNRIICDNISAITILRAISNDTLVFSDEKSFTFEKSEDNLLIKYDNNKVITLKDAFMYGAYVHTVNKIEHGGKEINIKEKINELHI